MSGDTSRGRRLIVNADDFGFTSGINRGIVEAHQRGILTSASLMVRYPAAAEAAECSRSNPRLSVGLHFDAGEWRYRNGQWEPAYRVIDTADASAVNAELERQLGEFERLLGRAPSHLDSHQHMHLSEPARSLFTAAAERLGVPLRSCSAVRFEGSFYGQTTEGEPHPEGITAEHLAELIAQLPEGWTEIGCHPGYMAGLDSVYARERENELRALCSDAARDAVERSGVQLRSFADFRC